MSDYRIFFRGETDTTEVDVPDYYKDSDSVTTTEQIKIYLCKECNILYDDLLVDLIRNNRTKKNIKECDIEDGDELYFYLSNMKNQIDLKRLKLKIGFSSVNEIYSAKYGFRESHLNEILSDEEEYREKISEIIERFDSVLSEQLETDDKYFILESLIFRIVKSNIYSFPYHKFHDGYYFGKMRDKLPYDYGFYFDFISNTYYEGFFDGFYIKTGKHISLEQNSQSYGTCDIYQDFKQNGRGIRKYFLKNELYVGSFLEGYYHSGNLLNDIGKYNGLFKNGLYHGYGIINYNSGETYSGIWCNGKRNISGKIKYQNGNYYSGSWNNDSIDDFGCYYDKKMDITYIGTFKDGKRSFIKDEFTLIQGHLFLSDLFGEYQVNFIVNNSKIKQEINQKIFDGPNIILVGYNNETKEKYRQVSYFGHFNFLKHFYGLGKMYYNHSNDLIINNYESYDQYSNEFFETKYKGFRYYHVSFEDGYPNGFGLIKYENGDKYIGNIKNGHITGSGTLYKFNGEKIRGFWNNNILINTK